VPDVEVLMKLLALFLATAGLAAGGSLPFARDGVIDTPDISLLAHTQLRVGSVITMFSYENASGETDKEYAVAGHLEFGLLDFAQVGLCYLGDAGLSAHLKVLPIKETLGLPGVAIGVQNITGQEDYEFYETSDSTLYSNGRKQNFSAYIVLTKDLRYVTGIPVDISLGWGMGRFYPDRPDSGETDAFIPGLFGSTCIRAGDSFRFMVEWDGRDLNAGSEYDISSLVTAQVAVAEIETLFSSGEQDRTDVMQNMKVGFGLELTIGPLYNPNPEETLHLTEMDRRDELAELEALRREAEETLRRLQEMLENREQSPD
jgi:hypothetical protein